MRRSTFFAVLAVIAIAGVIAAPVAPPPAEAADDKGKKKEIDAAIEKGLEYLKKQQANDGHFAAQGGQYPTTMTALAGMCFLMEGSTLKEGKYSEQIQKAVNWFLAAGRVTTDGKIGDPRNPTESTRYMYGQGFGTLFLASVYGEEEDKEQREKLEKILKKSVDFICKAQTSKDHKMPEGKTMKIGGWGYVSAAETGGGGFDEGSVTITALQGLRAAKNAGIPVPKESIDKAVAYLEACTTPDGGIIYSYAGGSGAALKGQGRPPLTAAAICCGFSAGQYKSELPKKWIKYCKDNENIFMAKGRQAHDEYQTYYFAQAMYAIGDDKYGEMFPDSPKDSRLTWAKFKEIHFPQILENQDKTNGGWSQGYIGPIFVTSVNLTILQLDKGILPFYQR